MDLNESLAHSSVAFVPVRHEQGGAYMADMYGRLTGRAGVCLGHARARARLNLVTAVADAFLDRAPLVALTGQADLERMHKESHQYIDLVELLQPDHEVERARQRARHHPRGRPQGVQGRRVREARRRPTSSCPRTSWRAEVDARAAAAPRDRVEPEPSARELLKAADLIRDAINPVALAGNGVIRAGAAPALREFARATGIAVAETFMGKGAARLRGPAARWAPSGCSRATTRSRASRTPTS